MCAKKSIFVHVNYGSGTSIVNSTRSEFLQNVSEKFGLKEDEIEIYDKKSGKLLNVGDLADVHSVRVERKTQFPVNGKSHPPVPSTSKEPDRKALVRKLLDNRALTGVERAFLVKNLEEPDYPALKRKGDDSVRPEMKNRKVQVMAPSRTYATQTDELINYEPSSPNSTITAENNRILSKKMVTSDKMDAAVANDLMSRTFNKRRNFILIERPIAVFVKEKYPQLFSNIEVKNELDRIFYDGKCKEFIANIEKYSPSILSMARDDDPLLLTTKSKMDAFKTPAQKSYAQDVGALLMISSLMQEDRNFIQLKDKECNPGDFPYITCQAKQNDLYFDNHLFRIYVERIMLCEASDFKDAILCLMACYFIFNISYPETNFMTLVTIEKLFLEANDTNDNDIELAAKQIIRCIQLKWEARSGS